MSRSLPVPTAEPSSKHAPRVLMMAAGTGGHVFPALAVAQALEQQGATVHWLGTLMGMENDLLADTGFVYHAINMQGLRRNGMGRLIKAPGTLLKATLACVKIIRSNHIDVVVGFGGYVTAPGGLAAKICKVPLLIHEQNAIAGMSNRYLAKMANRVLQAFPNTFRENKPDGLVTVGNPVREAIVELPPPEARIDPNDQSPLRLLVIGGSLGAQVLNQTIAPTLKLLENQPSQHRPPTAPNIQRWQVRHQCGRNNLTDTQAVYDQADLQHTQYEVTPFIADMAEAYAWADVIVCRAGALTVTEVATAGLLAVFVPLPHAVDDHQTANARWLANQDAAILMPQPQLTAEHLAQTLGRLDRATILAKAKKARALAQPDATAKVAALVLAACQTKPMLNAPSTNRAASNLPPNEN